MLKENLCGHEHNVARNRNIKVVSGEISEGEGEHDVGKWRKGDSCSQSGKNTAELCFFVV